MMSLLQLAAAVTPPSESWPAIGAFLGAAISHRLNRRAIRRMVSESIGLELSPLVGRIGRLEGAIGIPQAKAS